MFKLVILLDRKMKMKTRIEEVKFDNKSYEKLLFKIPEFVFLKSLIIIFSKTEINVKARK